MYKNKRIEYLALFISIVIVWIYYFFGFEGYYGWDDMEYARLAYQWANGILEYKDNHFAYRHPVIWLTGLSYKWFGLSDFTSALPALLLSMIILTLVFILIQKNDTRVVITALFMTLLMPYFLRYSHKLMSDLYVATGILSAFAAIYFYKFRFKKYSALWAIMLSTSLFVAFLSKEVVILILPFFLIMLIYDLLKKQMLHFWAWFFIVSIILFTAYHIYIGKLTGNIWMRYIAIQHNAYLNPCSYEVLPFTNTLERILYKFWNECLLSGLLWPTLFLFYSITKKSKFLNFSSSEVFWLNSSLIALFLANFMTKRYDAYSPMCLDMRHYLYLIPIIAIASAPYIIRYFYSIKRNWDVFCFFIVAGIVYFIQYFSSNKVHQTYFVITVSGMLIIISIRIIKENYNTLLSTTLWALFLLSWLAFPISQIIHQSPQSFYQIKPFIDKHFSERKSTLVLADPILKRIADYYMAWDSTCVRFINDRSPIIPYREEASEYFVYRNGLTWWFLEKKYPEPMLLWYLKEPNIQLIDSTYGNYLYKIIRPDSILRPVDTMMFYCDMEFDVPYFTNVLKNLDYQVVYSGKYSQKVETQGFSSTLSRKLDFINSKTSKIEIEANAKILMKDFSKTKMVISVNDSLGNTIFWLGKPVLDMIKPSDQWQDVKFRASYKPHYHQKNYTLKAYIWNDDTTTVWIDDIFIKLIQIDHL